jgi:hypothetical protein
MGGNSSDLVQKFANVIKEELPFCHSLAQCQLIPLAQGYGMANFFMSSKAVPSNKYFLCQIG